MRNLKKTTMVIVNNYEKYLEVEIIHKILEALDKDMDSVEIEMGLEFVELIIEIKKFVLKSGFRIELINVEEDNLTDDIDPVIQFTGIYKITF